MRREELATHIAARIAAESERLGSDYCRSAVGIGYFVLDDLFPAEIADAIATAFPPPAALSPRRNLRERKAVSAHMNRFNRLIEEALFAFQDRRVVEAISAICGLECAPDPHLYAGGISAMRPGDFLNPHLDNSHDGERSRWRVLNLLYYCSPGWTAENGGSLELWPHGVRGSRIEIPALFNRLVVMTTSDRSWHSVSPVTHGIRRCISNYFFADAPVRAGEKAHVTLFRARPGHPALDLALRADSAARQAFRRLLPRKFEGVSHRYHTTCTEPVQDRMPEALMRPAIE